MCGRILLLFGYGWRLQHAGAGRVICFRAKRRHQHLRLQRGNVQSSDVYLFCCLCQLRRWKMERLWRGLPGLRKWILLHFDHCR